MNEPQFIIHTWHDITQIMEKKQDNHNKTSHNWCSLHHQLTQCQQVNGINIRVISSSQMPFARSHTIWTDEKKQPMKDDTCGWSTITSGSHIEVPTISDICGWHAVVRLTDRSLRMGLWIQEWARTNECRIWVVVWHHTNHSPLA